jgi:hypothetical protein
MARSIDEPRAYYVRGKWIVLAKDSRRRGWNTPFKASRLQVTITLAFKFADVQFQEIFRTESSLNRQ